MFVPPDGPWAEVGYDVARVLQHAGLALRILATAGGLDFRPRMRWVVFAKELVAAVADQYVNIVVGVNPITELRLRDPETDRIQATPLSDLVRLHTSLVPNVAIIGAAPRKLTPDELRVLTQYNMIVLPTAQDRDVLPTDLTWKLPPSGTPDMSEENLKILFHVADALKAWVQPKGGVVIL